MAPKRPPRGPHEVPKRPQDGLQDGPKTLTMVMLVMMLVMMVRDRKTRGKVTNYSPHIGRKTRGKVTNYSPHIGTRNPNLMLAFYRTLYLCSKAAPQGPLFGASCVVLGRLGSSWAVLVASGSVLGPSWSRLGPSW